jgi:hypothetical protein
MHVPISVNFKIMIEWMVVPPSAPPLGGSKSDTEVQEIQDGWEGNTTEGEKYQSFVAPYLYPKFNHKCTLNAVHRMGNMLGSQLQRWRQRSSFQCVCPETESVAQAVKCVPTLQGWSPEFKPQSHTQKKSRLQCVCSHYHAIALSTLLSVLPVDYKLHHDTVHHIVSSQ